jgi:hypothetical protein
MRDVARDQFHPVLVKPKSLHWILVFRACYARDAIENIQMSSNGIHSFLMRRKTWQQSPTLVATRDLRLKTPLLAILLVTCGHAQLRHAGVQQTGARHISFPKFKKILCVTNKLMQSAERRNHDAPLPHGSNCYVLCAVAYRFANLNLLLSCKLSRSYVFNLGVIPQCRSAISLPP